MPDDDNVSVPEPLPASWKFNLGLGLGLDLSRLPSNGSDSRANHRERSHHDRDDEGKTFQGGLFPRNVSRSSSASSMSEDAFEGGSGTMAESGFKEDMSFVRLGPCSTSSVSDERLLTPGRNPLDLGVVSPRRRYRPSVPATGSSSSHLEFPIRRHSTACLGLVTPRRSLTSDEQNLGTADPLGGMTFEMLRKRHELVRSSVDSMGAELARRSASMGIGGGCSSNQWSASSLSDSGVDETCGEFSTGVMALISPRKSLTSRQSSAGISNGVDGMNFEMLRRRQEHVRRSIDSMGATLARRHEENEVDSLRAEVAALKAENAELREKCHVTDQVPPKEVATSLDGDSDHDDKLLHCPAQGGREPLAQGADCPAAAEPDEEHEPLKEEPVPPRVCLCTVQ